jgi:hypothetical protein
MPGDRVKQPTPELSRPERRTLRHIADAALAASEMDWLALQGLRKLGLADETLGAGWKLTKEGRRVLRLLGEG